MTRWVPDLLGPGWEQTTLELGEDVDGPAVATLVRRVPGRDDDEPPAADGRRPAVLYVHGFNDYFFQTHLAEYWHEQGYTFYALDLRRCGRSWRPWQLPHYCTDLAQYGPELDEAARLIRAGHDHLTVMAHSTGGLTASLWTHSRRDAGVVDALVLNGPWLELDAHWLTRTLGTRLLDALGPLGPTRVVSHRFSAYSHHLHVDHGGRWEYDLTLKPPAGCPARAGWLRAVRRGQAQVARGLQIDVPVLVCAAGRSGPNTLANPDLDRQDTIVDVRHVAARAPRLGPDVSVVQIPDGIHDLSLAAPVPRAAFFAAITDWLGRRDGPTAPPARVSRSAG